MVCFILQKVVVIGVVGLCCAATSLTPVESHGEVHTKKGVHNQVVPWVVALVGPRFGSHTSLVGWRVSMDSCS